MSISLLNYVDEIDVVIVDGGSDDDTLDVIKIFNKIINSFVSAPDDGEYDAMNKGIDLSQTENLLFIMAGDCLIDIDGDLSSLNSPCFIPVYRKTNKGGQQNLRPKSTMLFGLPHCHQGIIFRKSKIRYDTNYKISADYKYYLSCGYPSVLPLYQSPFHVLYDEGYSGENFLKRDAEIVEISRIYFGSFIGYVSLFIFKLKHLVKFLLGRG